jgi:MerR family Zn(II)-responsive transcriptional regulator of zntA
MLINELAKRTGITAHTIRFYEKSGLIKGERKEEVKSNNYFHYNEEAVERLELIRDAKAVGFTISEIGQLIDAWFNNIYTQEEKILFLDEKLKLIDEKIQDLEGMKKLVSEYKADVLDGQC